MIDKFLFLGQLAFFEFFAFFVNGGVLGADCDCFGVG